MHEVETELAFAIIHEEGCSWTGWGQEICQSEKDAPQGLVFVPR